MGIYIKGMKMPTNGCPTCWISPYCFHYRFGMYGTDGFEKPCPLVPVPDHGRLIDTDAVSLEGGPYEYDEWCKWALEQYQDAPTIIPAEEGEG